MSRSKLALKDFLERNCRIIPAPGSTGDAELYIFITEDGRPFMTESHLREIFRATGQKGSTPAGLKRDEDEEAAAIIVQGRKEPEMGISQIRIPVKLIESLSEQQSFLVLRNLEGIKTDIDEGRLFRDRLEALFQDSAAITLSSTPEGARVYVIIGKLSPSDRRMYMERFAEQIASKTLFDVAKALNARLEEYIPEDSRGKFFLEGRDNSDRKIAYGTEVSTELVLSDEGAWTYTTIASKNPNAREVILKLFQQAMTDPFGLSMRHYMGKHNVMKAGKRPLVKMSGMSSFKSWVKGLFG